MGKIRSTEMPQKEESFSKKNLGLGFTIAFKLDFLYSNSITILIFSHNYSALKNPWFSHKSTSQMNFENLQTWPNYLNKEGFLQVFYQMLVLQILDKFYRTLNFLTPLDEYFCLFQNNSETLLSFIYVFTKTVPVRLRN